MTKFTEKQLKYLEEVIVFTEDGSIKDVKGSVKGNVWGDVEGEMKD